MIVDTSSVMVGSRVMRNDAINIVTDIVTNVIGINGVVMDNIYIIL